MENVLISSNNQLNSFLRNYITEDKEKRILDDFFFVVKYSTWKEEKEEFVCFEEIFDNLFQEKRVKCIEHDFADKESIRDYIRNTHRELDEENIEALCQSALSCVRGDKWYEPYYVKESDGFLPHEFVIVDVLNSSQAVDYLLLKKEESDLNYAKLRENSKIIDWYKRVDALGAKDDEDKCLWGLGKYYYGIDEDTRKWFSDAFDVEIPVLVKDISSDVKDDIYDTVKERIDIEESKEKWKQQRAERGWSDCDSWNIYSWFLETVTPALENMRENLHGHPAHLSGYSSLLNDSILSDKEDPDMKKWMDILDRMIFLAKEMNEETCSYVNPTQEEVDKAQQEFESKYGLFGSHFAEKNSIEEPEGGKRVYFYHDDPEHPEWIELNHEWYKNELCISQYRDKCREEFFQLFSLYFWDLWD